jgi:hypothetical protein
LLVGRQAELRLAVIPRMEPHWFQTGSLAGRGRLAYNPSARAPPMPGTTAPAAGDPEVNAFS